MSTTTLVSLGLLTVFLILYLLKRRSRVRRDDLE
jgi:hypothetical protein